MWTNNFFTVDEFKSCFDKLFALLHQFLINHSDCVLMLSSQAMNAAGFRTEQNRHNFLINSMRLLRLALSLTYIGECELKIQSVLSGNVYSWGRS